MVAPTTEENGTLPTVEAAVEYVDIVVVLTVDVVVVLEKDGRLYE